MHRPIAKLLGCVEPEPDEPEMVRCPECNGMGYISISKQTDEFCEQCNGTGKVPKGDE